MATIPTVPDEKDTTKVSFAQSVVESLAELNAEVVSTSVLKNGSFEDIESGEPLLWVVTDESGGSHAVSDATESGGEAHHGKRSLQIITTGLGGFAEALSDLFLPIGELDTVIVEGFVRRDTASIRTRVQVLYYNENLSLVATDTISDDTTIGGSTYFQKGGTSTAPASAHYYKIKLIGGEVGNAISSNVFFDGFSAAPLLRPPSLEPVLYLTSGVGSYVVPDGVFALNIAVAGGGGGGGGSVGGLGGGGGGSGYIDSTTVYVTPGESIVVSVGAKGAAGLGGAGNGGDGIQSWVGRVDFANRFVVAAGGLGGKSSNSGSAGGIGWNNGSAYSAPNGGNGADHIFGTAGLGGTTGDGTNATGNCAGGGGSGSAGFNGGDGADGYVLIAPQLI